ncbi:MAG: hypothetical protein ABW187_08290 [Dokdonella sp.]
MSTTLKTNRLPRCLLAFSLAAACLAAGTFAAAAPPMPPGPHGPPLPSAEELATIPSLSTPQQIELRKILLERRDALEAARDKTRDAMEAQHKRERADVERIEEQSSERLRKLLGDDGFRRYAEWRFAQRGPHEMDGPHHGDDQRGPRRDGPGPRPEAAPAPPGAPVAGDAAGTAGAGS